MPFWAIEQCRSQRCEMAASRETHHADPIRTHSKFCRAGPHDANRPQHVLQHRRMVISRADTVLDDESGDATGCEPARCLVALVVHGEMLIAAAGTHHDSGAGILRRRRQVDDERRLVFVFGALRSRRAVGPEQFSRGVAHRREILLRRHLWRHGHNDKSHEDNPRSAIHNPQFWIHPVFLIPAATPLTVTRNALRRRSSLPTWRKRWSNSTWTRLIGSTYGLRTSIDRRSTGLSSSSSPRPATTSTAADVFGSRCRRS